MDLGFPTRNSDNIIWKIPISPWMFAFHLDTLDSLTEAHRIRGLSLHPIGTNTFELWLLLGTQHKVGSGWSIFLEWKLTSVYLWTNIFLPEPFYFLVLSEFKSFASTYIMPKPVQSQDFVLLFILGSPTNLFNHLLSVYHSSHFLTLYIY